MPRHTRHLPRIATILTIGMLLAGCATESPPLPLEVTAHGTWGHAPRFSVWSEPVNLGPIVNSPDRDINPRLSPDGRSLYFNSNRPGGFGNNDLWVSHRDSRHGEWQAPVNLGPVINSAFDDGGASLSDDGLRLYFNSNRPGGLGISDLYMSRRDDPEDDQGWGLPINLGPNVNTAEGERGPEFFGGHRNEPASLYFNRGILALQGSDLYAAPLTEDGEPSGPAQLLAVSTPGANDAGQSVSGHGRAIFFWSNRPGTSGPADIWFATRRHTRDEWSAPANLGAPVNTVFAEERPNLSRDGRTLLFDSDRPGAVGGQDLWMASRVTDDDDEADDDDEELPRFTDWSAPVNLGPVVNSPAQEVEVVISRSGLSLFVSSNRSGNFDLWVAQRASQADAWGPPQNIGPAINTTAREQAPFLSGDGHRLYFMSDRAGGAGGLDLYVSRRHDKRDDFGWQPPENLGSVINSSAEENLPVLFEDDDGAAILYFVSNRDRPAGVPGDIYASKLQDDGLFGAPVLIGELSSPRRDRLHTIRRDGREAFLGSDRPGPAPAPFDMWVATRASSLDPWSTPIPMGAALNSAADDTPGSLSHDGTTLYILSARPGTVGGLDVWVSTRTRLRGR